MLNQVMLVGRIANELEIIEENNNKICNLTLQVENELKNENGGFEYDYIDCILLNYIAESVIEKQNKGDVIGIKGKIKTSLLKNSEGKTVKDFKIFIERVSFLSNNF